MKKVKRCLAAAALVFGAVALVLVVNGIMATLVGCSGEYVPVYTDWTIYEKNYVPAKSGTNGRWAYSFFGDSGFTYIEGDNSSPARYEFMLRREENGETKARTEEVEQSEYITYEVGDTYTVETWEWVSKEEKTNEKET